MRLPLFTTEAEHHATVDPSGLTRYIRPWVAGAGKADAPAPATAAGSAIDRGSTCPVERDRRADPAFTGGASGFAVRMASAMRSSVHRSPRVAESSAAAVTLTGSMSSTPGAATPAGWTTTAAANATATANAALLTFPPGLAMRARERAARSRRAQ
ncbi:hypothetical protein GCM10009634_55790 [Saccharothrix xinjiangensis]